MKQTRETASKEAREIQEKGQVVTGMFKGDVEKFKEEYSKSEQEAKVKINLDHVIAQKTQIGMEIQASVEKIVQNLDEATRKIIEIKGLSAWEKFLSIFGGSGKNAAVRHHLRRVKSQNISENINTTIDFSRYYEQSLGMLIEEGTRELGELVALRDRLNQDYTTSVREAQERKARLDELDVKLEEKEKDRENALVEDRGAIEAGINRLQDQRRELHDQWQQASIRGRLAQENYETAKNYVAAFDTSTKNLKAIQLKLQVLAGPDRRDPAEDHLGVQAGRDGQGVGGDVRRLPPDPRLAAQDHRRRGGSDLRGDLADPRPAVERSRDPGGQAQADRGGHRAVP